MYTKKSTLNSLLKPLVYNIIIFALCQTVYKVPEDVSAVKMFPLPLMKQAQPCISNTMLTLCQTVYKVATSRYIYCSIVLTSRGLHQTVYKRLVFPILFFPRVRLCTRCQ